MSAEHFKLNISCIQDPAVRQALTRESELRAELAALRQPLRELQDRKDASIRSFQPKQEKFLNSIDSEWEELQKEKNRLHAEMDALKVVQHERQQAVDELRMLGLEIEPIRREVVETKAKVAEAARQVQELEEKRSKLAAHLRYKSQHEADQEIATFEREIAAATKKGDQKTAAALLKEKANAEKGRKDIGSVSNTDERIQAAKKKHDGLHQQLDEAQHRLDEKEASRTVLRTKLDTDTRGKRSKGEGDDPYKALLTQVKAIGARLDDLRQKRKERKPINTELDDVNAEIVAHKDKRTAIMKELDELQKVYRPRTVNFDNEFRGDLVGKGGATIDQIQTDFGVALIVDDGVIKLIGGQEECEAAAQALEATLTGIKRSRQKATVPFDMKLARGLIGTGGSNIQRIQNASGAELKLKQNDGEIALIGSPEAIAIAKEMIAEFVSNNASEELKFDPSLRDIMIGKGGATIRRIETESGVKRLHVDRDKSVINMSGTAEAVAKAKAAYQELIEGSANAFTMRADDRMTRLVIGPKGKTINEIQDATKAMIECRNGTVTIRGSRDAVEAARRMIEEVTRREEVKVPFDSCLYSTLTTRPLVAPEEGAEGGRTQQEELPTPLEEIKQVCNCDQISAIRGESKIVIRGKQQNVNQARTMINELLRKLQPDVAKVSCPEVLLGAFIKRGTDRLNYLDRLKLKFPGIIHCDIDRKSKAVELAGGKDDVANASREVTSYIDEAKPFIGTTSVSSNAIGAVLGSGGSNVSELQRKYAVEVHIDRDSNVVIVFSPNRDREKLEAALAAVEALKSSARK